MDASTVIKVHNVSKEYHLYDKPIDRLKESINLLGRKYYKEFHALRNVSFEVRKGETIGIIGRNGSGKSTLLKLITGVLTPTVGSIDSKGRIAAILELGAGFNLEYTGIENIYLNGTLLGYSKEEIDNKLDAIIAFADIGEFIDQPVKTYSSGMFSRLAFAVAINVDPDILIVDEALAVGDVKFQTKCFNRFKDLKEKGVTILFVGHDVFSVRSFCDRAMWLNEGELVQFGDTLMVTAEYMQFMNEEQQNFETSGSDTNRNESEPEGETFNPINRWGSHIGLIKSVEIHDQKNRPSEILNSGDNVKIKIRFYVPNDINLTNLSVAFSIKNTLGIDILVSTIFDYDSIRISKYNCLVEATFEFTNYLNQGDYILVVALENRENSNPEYYDFIEGAKYFKVLTNKKVFGMLNVPVIQDLNYIGEN